MITELKDVLVVGSQQRTLDMYETILGNLSTSRGGAYLSTLVFYDGLKTNLPTSAFDLAIMDGLDGDGLRVARLVNADKKILCSDDTSKYSDEVRKDGLTLLEKPLRLGNLLEALE